MCVLNKNIIADKEDFEKKAKHSRWVYLFSQKCDMEILGEKDFTIGNWIENIFLLRNWLADHLQKLPQENSSDELERHYALFMKKIKTEHLNYVLQNSIALSKTKKATDNYLYEDFFLNRFVPQFLENGIKKHCINFLDYYDMTHLIIHICAEIVDYIKYANNGKIGRNSILKTILKDPEKWKRLTIVTE